MEALREDGRVSRRSVLQTLGRLGMAAAAGSPALGAPGAALGQGTLGALQPEEKVDATLQRLFGSRAIKDGSNVIKLTIPLIAENGAAALRRQDARHQLGLPREVPEPAGPRYTRRQDRGLPLQVDYRYKLMPVLSRYLSEDPEMARLIEEIRRPHQAKLTETLAVSETLLYRRGNFNGTFDEIILDALLQWADAEVAFSPGFRWGSTIVPGQPITLEDVYAHTALTSPNAWVRELTC